MVAPFVLRAGDTAPTQQSRTTCGSASLTIARMLVNPQFARWIRDGLGKDARDGDVPDAGTEIARRTNGVVGAGGRLQPPWPRGLGTPPWGALHELEFGAADPAADYDVEWFRFGSNDALAKAYAELRTRVRAGRPAVLYIGNAWSPRHVVLVMPATGAQELDVYEPSIGRVVDLPHDAFVARRLQMAGWGVPWAAVWDDSDS